MKNFLYILLILPFAVLAQTTSQNYVKTSVYKDSTKTSDASKTKPSITYYDGLGRPIQSIAGKASGDGKDVITHIEYDDFGRQPKNYLPYPASTSNLAFDTSAQTNTVAFYNSPQYENTTNPYSEKFLEASPLGRVNKTGAPGNLWKGNIGDNNDHTIKFAYLTNTSNDAVKKLTASALWNATNKVYDITFNSNSNATYAAGTIYKTITQNENKTGSIYTGTSLPSKQYTIEEFKNQQGQVLLKRTFNLKTNGVPESLDTYYIYDQFGNLTYVLPPMANGSGTATNLDLYGYQYKYDSRSRLVEKKLPGKQWEYIVYDSQDRVVATGPALSPFGGTQTGWMVTNYDAFGRAAYTGWYSQSNFSTTLRNTMQANSFSVVSRVTPAIGIDNVQVFYNNPNNAIFSAMKLLSVSYYDNYTWLDSGSQPTTTTQVEGELVEPNAKGMPTGSWQRVLTLATETFADIDYTLYDKKGRPVRIRSTNYLSGYTQNDTKMDFDNTVLYTITKHKRLAADTELVVREDFSFTPEDRLLNHSHKINSLTTESLATYTYDKLGRMVQKAVGSTGGLSPGALQYMDYGYNIRGWLTAINNITTLSTSFNLDNDLFAFKISYDGLYNGNISETSWRSTGDDVQRNYLYNYDKLNRLTNAFYGKPEQAVPTTYSYDETAVYDKNGNIVTMTRNGGLDDPTTVITIDDLNYTYSGNKLIAVDDYTNSPQGFKDVAGSTDYTYDANGNMITDNNKGITSTTYNHLNLPVEIVFGSSTKKISYLYNAAGIKVKKTVTDGSNVMIVDYIGGFQYKGAILQFFPTSEGYVDNTRVGTTNKYSYVYQYKDHSGNVRMDFVAFQAAKNGPVIAQIKEENHYYAFGMKHMNYNMDYLEYQEQGGDVVLAPPPITPTGKLPNNYAYSNKEYQDELGLNFYDYGARNYDPAIGRWMNIDPLTEKYYSESPFNYAMNNPVFFLDPDGNRIVIYSDSGSGQVSEEYKYEKNRDYTKMSGFKADAYKALDALYEASEIVIDGKKVNILEAVMNDKRELSLVYRGGVQNFAEKRQYNGKAALKKGQPEYTENVKDVLGTIFWDNSQGILYDDVNNYKADQLGEMYVNGKLPKTAKIVSPTSILGHEIGHAFHFLTDPDQYSEDKQSGNPVNFGPKNFRFKNMEEAKTTTLSTQINNNLKENPRYNHKGIGITVTGVRSTTPKN